MTLPEVLELRPFLYHLTARKNVPTLIQGGEFLSAKDIFDLGNRKDLLQTRRLHCEAVRVGGTEYVVRDQRPLQQGNMLLEDGLSFGEFVEILNSLIFFWPGNERAPIDMGLRHFERYLDENPVVLRVEFKALLDANFGISPKFARVNSGAPRCHPRAGKGQRGHGTFVEPRLFSGTAGDVKEVVFDRRLKLPQRVELGTIRGKSWIAEL